MKIYTHVYIAITVIYLFAQVSWCEDLRKSEFLLPGNLIPTHYDVNWEFLDDCSNETPQFRFDKNFIGDVRIMLTAIEPNVTAIELNCLNLKITRSVILIGRGLEYLELGLPECDSFTGKVTFHTPIGLPTSRNVVLWITFAGSILKKSDRGIWFDTDNVGSTKPGEILVKESIGTLFEPASARQAFPCFDEPKYKATYRLTLNVSTCVIKKGYVLLGNTPLESVQEWDDRSIVYFKKTDFLMPTYLFAFAISPYISTPVKFFNSSFPDVRGTEWKELRTWGMQDVVKGWIGYVGQEVGAHFLELFSRHLNIGYPLKKMDQVFNLHKSNIGGMENWGLISYSPQIRRNFTLVNLLGHEIAHQWFGNLVTCRWWSELWLNEGFATYFSFYGMDKLNAEKLISCLWNPKLIFIVHHLLLALGFDQKSYTHALTNPVEKPSEYRRMFDVISYSKGASVLRMWSHVLGEKVFIKGIQKYLRNNKFGSATPELLLEALDTVAMESASKFGDSGLPSKYFEKWHTQSGYPVVEVKKCPTNSSIYILTQINLEDKTNYCDFSRFSSFSPGKVLLNQVAKRALTKINKAWNPVFKITCASHRVFGKENSQKANWTIPISYSTNINKDFDKTHAMLWFKDQSNEERIVLPSSVNWIIVNNQFTGFYRVKYDRENYENLAQQLVNIENHRDIHEANRIQIVSDLFAFVKTDNFTDIDYTFFMDLTLYLKHETAYLPWKAALDYVIDYLNTMLGKNYAIYRFYKMYVNDLLEENYSKLTFSVKSGDSYNDKQLREEMVKWACKMDHPDCVRQSYYFVNSFSLGSQIHNKVYDTALCTNIRRNVENDWDILWESYQSTSDFQERNVILQGISCSSDTNILTRLLTKSLDETLMISEDERKSFFVAVLNSDPRNVDIALNFFSENYLRIEQMYGGYNPVSDLLLLLSEKVGTDEEVLKMEKITTVLEGEEKVSLRENALSEAIEICKSNNNWIKTKSQEVNVWLLSHYG